MATTIIETFAQYVELYNAARNEGNAEKAIRVGKKLVELARDELKKPSLSKVQRDYYSSVTASVSEYLADMKSGKSLATAGSGEDEDKIKSTDWFSAPVPDLTLNDIAGLSELKKEFVVNVLAPLTPKYAPIYRKYRGSELGVQIMLYGPPGTGKTHAVRCLAGALGCKVAVVQIKDVLANLVGDGAKIIHEIYRQAEQYDRSIIFFDEIDAIACSREGEDSRHTKEQLTTLLTCMDGFTAKAKPGQIRIVIAATNRPWALDSAVKRGGRFDTQIYVPLPDAEARRKLISLALRMDGRADGAVPLSDDITLEWLTERLEGYSGADVKAVCRQAVNLPLHREIMAASAGKEVPDRLTRADIEEVLKRYINSVTDEMLMTFNAYRLNMEYDDDYLDYMLDKTVCDLYADEEIEPFVLRWFSTVPAGYIQKTLGKKYDLGFLPEKIEQRINGKRS